VSDRKTSPEKPKDRDKDRNLTTEEISRQLQAYYDSIVDEGIPDGFLDLLDRLDKADKAQSGGSKD